MKISLKKEYLFALALTVFFAVSMNYDWRAGYFAWYGSLLLVFAMYLLTFNGRFRFNNISFELWFISFIALCAVSFLWALSISVAMDIIKSLIVVLAVLVLIRSALELGFCLDTLLRCYFIATLVNAIYIVFTIDIAQLGEMQLGTELLGGWNGNGIGFMMAQGVLIGWYLFQKAENKLSKLFYAVYITALIFLTLYTGSRTAFFMLVVEILLYVCLCHPTKIARNVLISFVLVAVVLYLVMNVESLYKVLGVRLEGLFALFSGEGEVDSSANVRDIFIENGKKWFSEKPFLGFGINNYKVLNQAATGRFVYAHNTFIELAVDLGSVGLIWYYSIYVYLIVRLLKSIKDNRMNVFLLSALVASLMSQYGTVSYYGFYQNFFLLLCFFAVRKAKKERIANRI